MLWLARELSTNEIWKERIIVIVSHDRFFIDEVCTDCLHISGVAKRLTQSHGNYSTWFSRRSEQQALFLKETLHRQDQIDKLKEYAGHGFKVSLLLGLVSMKDLQNYPSFYPPKRFITLF